MIFGDKKRFAIESETYAGTSSYLFGNMCIWAHEEKIGNYEQSIVLNTSVAMAERFLEYSGSRSHWTLENKSDKEVLKIIHGAYYSTENDEELSIYLPYVSIYKNMEICPQLSASFDGDKAVLLEDLNAARFIWQAFGEDTVKVSMLGLGECQRTFTEFVAWAYSLSA